MNKENFENWLNTLSKLQLVYCNIFLSQILQSYDNGLTLEEIQNDLDNFCYKEL